MRVRSAFAFIGLVAVLGAARDGLCAETYAYDALGRVILLSSDNNHQTVYSYDAAGNRTSVNVTTPANLQAPTVSNRTYSYTYGSGPLTINPTSLTVTGISAPTFGSASLSGSTITYTAPSTNVAATDSFTYSAQNTQGLTDSALILVNLQNASPVAHSDAYNFVFGSAATLTVDPRSNDTDPGRLALTIASVEAPKFGTVVNNGSSVTYTPPASHAPASDSFTYIVQDSVGGQDNGRVTINLTNAAPVAVADSISVPSGSATNFDPRNNDSDASGNALSVIAATQGVHGSTSFAASSIVYTAAAGYSGSDSFSYTISDPYGSTASANVAVTVTNTVNHPPTASDIPIDLAQNTSDTFNACAYASDPDGDTLTLTGVTQPTKGSSSASGCNVTYYAPSSSTNLLTAFQYTVSDPHGATATGTVRVTVEGGTQ